MLVLEAPRMDVALPGLMHPYVQNPASGFEIRVGPRQKVGIFFVLATLSSEPELLE